MRVMLFLLEYAFPVCVIFWMVVDLVIPAFTKALDKKSETKEYGKFFWFIGSIFASKPKKTFEEEIKDAEKAFKDAKTKMENLKSSATAETKEAKEHLSKAEKAFDDAKTKLEILKGKPEVKPETNETKK